MSSTLAPNVVHLLRTSIDSFEKLELVLALKQSEHVTMTVDELQHALRFSRETLRELITELSAAKLVEHTARGAVKLAPVEPLDAETLDALAAAWNLDRALVARTLSELAVARIREMAEQTLLKKPRGS